MFIQRLVETLKTKQVSYCVVGGVAVNLHGVPRMTYDVDVMVETSKDNLARCEEAFASLGLVSRLPVTLTDASNRQKAAEWERDRNLIAITYTDPSYPLNEVDVLVAPSLDPDGVVARSLVVGTGIRIACVADLIALKRRANRTQDISDIEHLERLAKR